MSGIRIADVTDMQDIVDLGLELLSQSIYSDIKPDIKKFKINIAGLMGSNCGLVLVVVDENDKPQGFIAGVVSEYGFSRARYATDMWTYVRDSYSRFAYRMYKQFIAWAKERPRIKFIEMAQSSGNDNHERWCKLMEKLGLVRAGSHYIMRF